ncbi:hypothetical protein [Streptomyces cirratus]|uniref:hypothetical protein n=1 Tax=Streptomyces cirratus TaxID=68187 RepID=UPI00167CFE31|nr:hypothetical protein [Streptomyces cirratus]
MGWPPYALAVAATPGHDYRGSRYAELDRETPLARRPQVVLTDQARRRRRRAARR